MTKTCAREGCENPLKTGSKYCSTNCANIDNGRRRAESNAEPHPMATELAQDVKVVRSGRIPKRVEQMFVDALGNDGASAILSELEFQMEAHAQGIDRELGMTLGMWDDWLLRRYPLGTASTMGIAVPRPSLKPPEEALIEPDSVLRDRYLSGAGYVSDVRKSGDVSFEEIDRLLKLGPYVMASRIKKGPIMSALSGKRKWSVMCSNAKLKTVIDADLERVLMRSVHDILLALDYGVAFGSVRWAKHTAEYIGVQGGVGKSSEWFHVDKIEWAHPSTVPEIIRNKNTNSFAGYYHQRTSMNPRVVAINPMQALVITYDSRFGNMWGQSMAEAIYDFAYWYEITMRAFLRYLQRMGTPVAVVYGPNRGTSIKPDGTRIDNPEYGLLLAGAAAFSSAIYLPSERDLQSGQQLWRMEYLDTDQKGDQFVAALQYLATQIARGVVVGDRVATQDGDTGSYNAGMVHAATTQIDNDFIFKSILGQLNDYLVARYGMWNVDYNSPPLARLRAEVIDPMEQEVLMKLFSTAGNIKLFEGSPLDRVDWNEAFKSIHVPVLSDTEFEKLYQEHLDRKKDNAEMFQQQGGMAGKAPFGKQPQPQPQQKQQPGSNGKAQTEEQRKQEARLSVLRHLSEGGLMPVLLMPDDVREWLVPEQKSILIDDTSKGVELGFLDQINRAMKKASAIVKTAPASTVAARIAGVGKQTTKEGEPVADPEFEARHPRDESGKFAKKEEEGAEEAPLAKSLDEV
jgi:hypothetical protein